MSPQLGFHRPGRIQRRDRPLRVEPLESRHLLSGTPELLTDIDLFVDSNAYGTWRDFVNVSGTAYFAGNDHVHGTELWKSDGTTAGTVMVKDIMPGDNYSSSLASASTFTDTNMANVNGTLFFAANDGTHGWELWKTDGTEAGTVMVKDIYPGPFSGIGPPYFVKNGGFFTNVNGTLFFSAKAPEDRGDELWKSDGTEAGTVKVKDSGTYGNYPLYLTNANGTLLFWANKNGTTHKQLWKSDGTEAGTLMVKDIWPAGNPWAPTNFMANVNGTLFFAANDGSHGVELWKSDGTEAGTVMVSDMVSGSGSSNPISLTEFNGTLFFARSNATGIYKSDGTDAGTGLFYSPSGPNVINGNGTLYFGSVGLGGLGKSDGTAAGTVVITSADPGYVVANAIVRYHGVRINDMLFYASRWPYVIRDSSTLVDQKLFYKGSSKWNVTNGATFSDDNAIAPDKTAYLPGSGTSAFSAMSSYDKGINGLMVDISGAHGAITASDFIFKVGNNNSPSTWATATAPTTVAVRSGAGAGGSDRIELMWADNAIQKQWLEVIVKGNDALGGSNTNTGLASSYVFYFGSAIGDSGAGNSGAFQVTSADEINARNNPKGVGDPATRSDVNDFNRDGLVNSSDQIIARNHLTSLGNQLRFLVIGAGGPFAPEAGQVASATAATPADTSGPVYGDLGIASGLTAGLSRAVAPPEAAPAAPLTPQPARQSTPTEAVDTYFERLALAAPSGVPTLLGDDDDLALGEALNEGLAG